MDRAQIKAMDDFTPRECSWIEYVLDTYLQGYLHFQRMGPDKLSAEDDAEAHDIRTLLDKMTQHGKHRLSNHEARLTVMCSKVAGRALYAQLNSQRRHEAQQTFARVFAVWTWTCSPDVRNEIINDLHHLQ